MSSSKARYQSRPIRVVFLVEDNPLSDRVLDAVFADCHSRWGGRFNLVAPTENGQIDERYRDWVRAYDPDVIYSYADLSSSQVDELHDQYYPSELIVHDTPVSDRDLDVHDLRPRFTPSAMSSMSLIGVMSGPHFHERPKKLVIADRYDGQFGEDVFEDCFGSHLRVRQQAPFPRHLSDIVTPLTLIPEGHTDVRGPFDDLEQYVQSVPGLFGQMSTQRIITFSQLSAFQTPRLELRGSEWGLSFALVVGSSFADRVCFWNGRSHYDTWLDGALVTLRIPSSYFEDDSFLDAIAEFLAYRNKVNGINSGQPSITLRSFEFSDGELEGFRDRLSKRKAWLHTMVAKIDDVTSCVPRNDVVESSYFLSAGGGIGSALKNWKEIAATGQTVRVPNEPPRHTKEIQREFSGYCGGAWAVDVEIGRDEGLLEHQRNENHWRLPRRLRMAAAFVRPYSIGNFGGEVAVPRCNLSGALTLYANRANSFPEIEVPSDEEAIRIGLLIGRNWFSREGDVEVRKEQIAAHLETSTQGRYFAGVIGMFGGSDTASNILLHKFWSNRFSEMGASTQMSETLLNKIGSRVAKRLKGVRQIDPDNSEQIRSISKVLLNSMNEHQAEFGVAGWPRLRDAFTELQTEYIANYLDGRNPEEIDEFRSHSEDRLKESLQTLCLRNVLHQGHRWKCSKCYHVNWISVRAFSDQMDCEVCGSVKAAPVEHDWQFRLNDFLSEAMRKHGVQSVLWTLNKLKGRFSKSFYFLGPNDFYSKEPPYSGGAKDSDIDLVCVKDGEVYVCEVKQSSRDIKDFENFLEIIVRVCPDKAVLAVMEPMNSRIQSAFAKFSKALEDKPITPVLLVREERDFDDTPFFR